MKFIFCLYLTSFLSTFIFASEEKKFEVKSESFFKRDVKKGLSHFQNSNFKREYLYNGADLVHVIYKVVSKYQFKDGEEGRTSQIEFSMFNERTGESIGTVIKTTKDELTLENDGSGNPYLKAVKFGCCGAENETDFINIYSGKIFASFVGQATVQTIGEYGKGIRVYAFEKYGEGNRYGTLRQFDSNGFKQELLVEFDGDSFDHLPWTPEVKVLKDQIVVKDIDCNDQVLWDLKVPYKDKKFYGSNDAIVKIKIKKPAGCKP